MFFRIFALICAFYLAPILYSDGDGSTPHPGAADEEQLQERQRRQFKLYVDMLTGEDAKYSGLDLLFKRSGPQIGSSYRHVNDYLVAPHYTYFITNENTLQPQFYDNPELAALIKEGEVKLKQHTEKMKSEVPFDFEGSAIAQRKIRELARQLDFPVIDRERSRAGQTTQSKLTPLQIAQIKGNAQLTFRNQQGRPANPSDAEDQRKLHEIETRLSFQAENDTKPVPQPSFREQTPKEYVERLDDALRFEKNTYYLKALQELRDVGAEEEFSYTLVQTDNPDAKKHFQATYDKLNYDEFRVDEKTGAILSKDGKTELKLQDPWKAKFKLSRALYANQEGYVDILSPPSKTQLEKTASALSKLRYASELNQLRTKVLNEIFRFRDPKQVKKYLADIVSKEAFFQEKSQEKKQAAIASIINHAETNQAIRVFDVDFIDPTPHKIDDLARLRWAGYPNKWKNREIAAKALGKKSADSFIQSYHTRKIYESRARTILSRAKAWGLNTLGLAAVVGVGGHIMLSGITSGPEDRTFVRNIQHPIAQYLDFTDKATAEDRELLRVLPEGAYRPPTPYLGSEKKEEEEEAKGESWWKRFFSSDSSNKSEAGGSAETQGGEGHSKTLSGRQQDPTNSGEKDPSDTSVEKDAVTFKIIGDADAENEFYYLSSQEELKGKALWSPPRVRHIGGNVILEPQAFLSPENGFISLPMSDGHELQSIAIQDVNGRQLSNGHDYDITYDPSKNIYGINFKNKRQGDVKIRPVLQKNSSTDIKTPTAELENLSKAKLSQVSTQLREAKLTSIADALDAALSKETPITLADIQSFVAETSVYTHKKEMQNLDIKAEDIAKNPFLLFSKFAISGIACGECDMGNAISTQILKQILPSHLEVRERVVAVGKEGEIGRILHVITEVYDSRSGKISRIDATPVRDESTLKEFQRENLSLEGKDKATTNNEVKTSELHAKQRKDAPSDDLPPPQKLHMIATERREEEERLLASNRRKAIATSYTDPNRDAPTEITPDPTDNPVVEIQSDSTKAPKEKIKTTHILSPEDERAWKERWKKEITLLNENHKKDLLKAINVLRKTPRKSLVASDFKHLPHVIQDSFSMLGHIDAYVNSRITLEELGNKLGLAHSADDANVLLNSIKDKAKKNAEQIERITQEIPPLLLEASKYFKMKKDPPTHLMVKAGNIMGIKHSEFSKSSIQESLNLFAEPDFIRALSQASSGLSHFAKDHPPTRAVYTKPVSCKNLL